MTLDVLVTGATGFIGRRLVPELLAQGHRVRAMTRCPDDYDGPGVAVYGDIDDADSLTEALADVEVAVYLVHSLDRDDFMFRDAEGACRFGQAAADAGVRQIVYLGGLGRDEDDLSPHLRSRREVEGLLRGAGVPVTVLRAGIVVGAGGVSWEITRELVENLPAMLVPRWASTLTQPIAAEDIIRYLAGVVGNPAALDRVLEVGGADRLTYREMLQQAAEEIAGHRLPIIPAPVLTPRLSSYWIGLVTSVDATTSRNLIDSMVNEVIQSDTAIRELVPGEPLGYREAVRRALVESD